MQGFADVDRDQEGGTSNTKRGRGSLAQGVIQDLLPRDWLREMAEATAAAAGSNAEAAAAGVQADALAAAAAAAGMQATAAAAAGVQASAAAAAAVGAGGQAAASAAATGGPAGMQGVMGCATRSSWRALSSGGPQRLSSGRSRRLQTLRLQLPLPGPGSARRLPSAGGGNSWLPKLLPLLAPHPSGVPAATALTAPTPSRVVCRASQALMCFDWGFLPGLMGAPAVPVHSMRCCHLLNLKIT